MRESKASSQALYFRTEQELDRAAVSQHQDCFVIKNIINKKPTEQQKGEIQILRW